MRLVLYQPDIPQNTGAMLRLGACFNTPVDLVEPCGFIIDDRRLRRSSMDYGAACDMTRHRSWDDFLIHRAGQPGRLVLLTTTASVSYADVRYDPADCLVLGRESAGVPQEVHDLVDLRVRIPIAGAVRSLNVGMAAAIVLTEALRQQGFFAGVSAL